MAEKKRYAIVGTGGRSVMYIDALLGKYGQDNELVALCDISQVRMDWHNRRVKDQFGAEEVKVYNPAFFAVPVRKWWEGRDFGISHPKAHLAIYKIYPSAAHQTVLVRDQFGRRYLQVVRSVLLAVPTLKLEWEES